MVSTLLVDVLPLLEPELELEPEPALQPTASRPAPMITPYLVRRLIPFVLTAVFVLTVRRASVWAEIQCLRTKRSSALDRRLFVSERLPDSDLWSHSDLVT